MEKKSFMTGATVGGLLGGASAPDGNKLEGMGRGAVRGAGIETGASLGGAAGLIGGAAAGLNYAPSIVDSGIGQSLLNSLEGSIGKLAPSDRRSEIVKALLTSGIAGAGAMGGAGLGGYLGHKVTDSALGNPSWKVKKPVEKKANELMGYSSGSAAPTTSSSMGTTSFPGSSMTMAPTGISGSSMSMPMLGSSTGAMKFANARILGHIAGVAAARHLHNTRE